jgi:hypothetical protein
MALTLDEQLLTKWVAFVQTVQLCAQEYFANSPDLYNTTMLCLGGVNKISLYDPGVIPAVRAYCGGEIPASREAILALNHSQLPNCLVLNGQKVDIAQIINLFSSVGHVACGRVWLSLLDVADAALPNTTDTLRARAFIQDKLHNKENENNDRMELSTTQALPPLDQLLGSVLGSFPGLQDCLQHLLANAMGDSGETGPPVTSIIDHMQESLLQPLLAKMQATPGAPDIGPAMQQILEGFKSLTDQLVVNEKSKSQ